MSLRTISHISYLREVEKLMKKKILITVGVIIFGLFFISTLGGDKSSNQATEVTNNGSNQSSEGSSQDVTPKVGDVTKLGDREFIVNSVRRSGAFKYNTPKAGKEYVIVNVTIKNSGKDEVTYNPFDFKVQDANGAQESTTFASLDDSLSSGTLASGGKVTGSMPFEVPIGDGAKLIYQPSFWSSQRIVVDLGTK